MADCFCWYLSSLVVNQLPGRYARGLQHSLPVTKLGNQGRRLMMGCAGRQTQYRGTIKPTASDRAGTLVPPCGPLYGGFFKLTSGSIAELYQLEATTARDLKKKLRFLKRQSDECEPLKSPIGISMCCPLKNSRSKDDVAQPILELASGQNEEDAVST
ncbi:hypothetical protein llap_12371 [Limosa lapponica baueri]|uniref:Uncharacterized protein n=1 Tax=Limosa lapponica baueri TaxID=1758121 RepID=A0A2I0TU53_LIMLA|nr:hypothetical protein llap_12371 [Limosa lapponica baueri]